MVQYNTKQIHTEAVCDSYTLLLRLTDPAILPFLRIHTCRLVVILFICSIDFACEDNSSFADWQFLISS